MRLRSLLPELVKSPNRPAFVRHGLAAVMEGSVGLTSFGKMTSDWRMRSVWMGDKRELRKFLDGLPKPYGTWRRRRLERAEFMAQSAVTFAQGAVELISCGALTTRWSMLWLCYGDDVFDWVAKKLEIDR